MVDEPESVVNVFLPCDVIGHCQHALFGIVQTFVSYTVVNCVGSVSCKECDFIGKISKICSQAIHGHKDLKKLSVIGFINDVSDSHRAFNVPGEINCFLKDIYFLLSVDFDGGKFGKLGIEKVQMGSQIQDVKRIRIIIYDGRDILLSRLVLTEEEAPSNEDLTVERMNFSKFLRNTTAAAANVRELSACKRKATSKRQLANKVLHCFPTLFYIMVTFLSVQCEHIYTILEARVPNILSKTVRFSSVGKHVIERLYHIHQITSSVIKKKPLPLRCGNLISAIMLDVLCGCIFTYLFWHCFSSLGLLQTVMEYTNIVVGELQEILYWLMGVPAGLKLNLPLNTALGHFFLYHIYLWKTYMTFIKPVFAFVLDSMRVLGVCGLTFVICLLRDLLSMATIHIYCFYGYAARLYGYQITGLSALWRLFRGKKWNPLRQRVDSYTYDVLQLYVGMLFFTVLIFLLPTVMAYYVVFTVLRIVVLTIQGMITRIVDVLSTFPLYVIILRLCNSKLTTGDVYFSVLQEQKVLVLNMQLVQIPLQSVIKRTLPENVTKQEPLSWHAFWDSLIWGKIIYPL